MIQQVEDVILDETLEEVNLEEILETLHAALDNFKGDKRKIAAAFAWLNSFYEEEEMTEEEKAELIQQIKEADADEGETFTTEQVKAHMAKYIENLQAKTTASIG